VHESGPTGAQPMVFAHGFGCDQHMWRHVAPRFADRFRVVLFDHVGAGGADRSAYDPDRHARLEGYADDVVALVRELDLRDVIYVGHSVSAMIGVLAAARLPDRFAELVLVGPSPRYLDDPETGYIGGFGRDDIEGLLESLESNYLGWSAAMAPAIVGNPQRPELGAELTESFCRADPEIQRRFARATFLADNRADLERVRTPALVLQCSDDIIAPDVVGEYVHRHLDGSTLVGLAATGHCPNLSAPEETTEAIEAYLRSRG
jgi:sigma-B regulation protein RsbQ